MMPKPTTNAIRMLLRLLAAPNRYTKRQLADFLGVKDVDSVSKYMDNIKAAGIDIDYDNHHRYFVRVGRGFKELDYLSPLSEADKVKIKGLLKDRLSTAEATQLYNKLESLYDFQQLGLEALRAPELEKINDIETAIREKKRVMLVNYRSRTGNDVRDRKVEAFGIEPERGMIRAYDPAPDKMRTSHFILSRMDRVRILDETWQYEKMHYHRPADAFDIVMDQTEMVHLTLSVSAYNELIERNPGARQYTRPGKAEHTWDFQGKVNEKFIGLVPFILANWRQVVVHKPKRLREQLAQEVEGLVEKFGVG
jgi:predicted DNA-binding transcriptional regulator YafY